VNPYAILGLHPSAGSRAIERTYWRLIRECRPDVAGTEATARAADLASAYAILGDPDRRAEFDSNLGNVLRGWVDKRWHWQSEHCPQCGVEIHWRRSGDASYSPTGRKKRRDQLYCSNACRQCASRARQAAVDMLPPGHKTADP
jgi:curved DNA-binding protein CbpA